MIGSCITGPQAAESNNTGAIWRGEGEKGRGERGRGETGRGGREGEEGETEGGREGAWF